jgi:hypothetical protein
MAKHTCSVAIADSPLCSGARPSTTGAVKLVDHLGAGIAGFGSRSRRFSRSP